MWKFHRKSWHFFTFANFCCANTTFWASLRKMCCADSLFCCAINAWASFSFINFCWTRTSSLAALTCCWARKTFAAACLAAATMWLISWAVGGIGLALRYKITLNIIFIESLILTWPMHHDLKELILVIESNHCSPLKDHNHIHPVHVLHHVYYQMLLLLHLQVASMIQNQSEIENFNVCYIVLWFSFNVWITNLNANIVSIVISVLSKR